jgi:hypothetical protein
LPHQVSLQEKERRTYAFTAMGIEFDCFVCFYSNSLGRIEIVQGEEDRIGKERHSISLLRGKKRRVDGSMKERASCFFLIEEV